MNSALSLPPKDDLDTQMLRVARDIAMDIYPIVEILENNSISIVEFNSFKDHPRFLEYLKSETEAWKAATNTIERTKLKAAVVMEEFMVEAHGQLNDKKIPLNHRVELGKLVAKIAGMGEPKLMNIGGNTPTFQLNINIGQNKVRVVPQMAKIINHDAPPPIDAIPEEPEEYALDIPVEYGVADDDDGYNPLVSPSTLED